MAHSLSALLDFERGRTRDTFEISGELLGELDRLVALWVDRRERAIAEGVNGGTISRPSRAMVLALIIRWSIEAEGCTP